MKPPIQEQGKVVAQDCGTCSESWYVMFPDGGIRVLAKRKDVEKAAKVWFKKHVEAGKIGIGRIEWRT